MSGGVVPLSLPRQHELIAEARPMVLKQAKERCALSLNLMRKAGLTFEDLVSIGNLELSHVVRGFDELLGKPFSVYAWPAVNGAMKDAIERMTRLERAVCEGASKAVAEQLDDRDRYGETSPEKRQEAVEGFSDTLVAGMLIAVAVADPEGHAMASELRAKVLRSVSELSVKDRRLIALHYFEDQTLEEVGVALRISKETVKRRHRKILARLGARLSALGVDGVPA